MDEPRNKRVIPSAEREVTPAFTLNKVGKIALERARKNERDTVYDVIAAQLMCALTMEAVLNYVGSKLFVDDAKEPQVWAAVERLRPKEKLVAVAERAGLSLDLGVKPFQAFGPMFRFRDHLAHGKPVSLPSDNIPPEAVDDQGWLLADKVPELQAPWERQCDLNTAEQWRDSVDEMTATLCKAADCMNPIFARSLTSWPRRIES